ncbi:hypothetical protein TNCV_2018641 [Trichonephila clavipes]|nr:hypothetical protein TNCV_2018641 [Trichonephila clavipes]
MHAKSKIQQSQSNYRAIIPSVSYSKVVSGQIENDEGVAEKLLARLSEQHSQHSENFFILTIRPVKFFRPMSR